MASIPPSNAALRWASPLAADGCALLEALGRPHAQLAVGYVRYMEDWVVLAPTRWKLREAIRAVNEIMAQLPVTQHPGKTIIGRTTRGFDILGYQCTAEGVAVPQQTVERCSERVSRLYEQGADAIRIGTYLPRWARWVTAGLGELWVTISGTEVVDDVRRSRSQGCWVWAPVTESALKITQWSCLTELLFPHHVRYTFEDLPLPLLRLRHSGSRIRSHVIFSVDHSGFCVPATNCAIS